MSVSRSAMESDDEESAWNSSVTSGSLPGTSEAKPSVKGLLLGAGQSSGAPSSTSRISEQELGAEGSVVLGKPTSQSEIQLTIKSQTSEYSVGPKGALFEPPVDSDVEGSAWRYSVPSEGPAEEIDRYSTVSKAPSEHRKSFDNENLEEKPRLYMGKGESGVTALGATMSFTEEMGEFTDNSAHSGEMDGLLGYDDDWDEETDVFRSIEKRQMQHATQLLRLIIFLGLLCMALGIVQSVYVFRLSVAAAVVYCVNSGLVFGLGVTAWRLRKRTPLMWYGAYLIFLNLLTLAFLGFIIWLLIVTLQLKVRINGMVSTYKTQQVSMFGSPLVYSGVTEMYWGDQKYPEGQYEGFKHLRDIQFFMEMKFPGIGKELPNTKESRAVLHAVIKTYEIYRDLGLLCDYTRRDARSLIKWPIDCDKYITQNGALPKETAMPDDRTVMQLQMYGLFTALQLMEGDYATLGVIHCSVTIGLCLASLVVSLLSLYHLCIIVQQMRVVALYKKVQ